MGLSVEDLDLIESGLVWDMMAENSNDDYEYPLKATQDQFNEFIGR